jgi:hypothetical protein
MQLVTMIGQMLESGKLTLSTNSKEEVEVTAANKRIDVNLKDKEFIKYLITDVRKSGTNERAIKAIKVSSERIKAVKSMRDTIIDMADELSQVGITVTLSYRSEVIATAGAQARSGISRLLTGTKAIEINSFAKLAELGISTL